MSQKNKYTLIGLVISASGIYFGYLALSGGVDGQLLGLLSVAFFLGGYFVGLSKKF